MIAEEIEVEERTGAEDRPGAEERTGAESGVRTSLLLRAGPTAVYVAVAVIGIGFALIATTWGLVAGTAEVARQIPYVVSGGLSGLGFVIVGIGLLVIVIRSRESATRRAQYEELATLLRRRDKQPRARRGGR